MHKKIAQPFPQKFNVRPLNITDQLLYGGKLDQIYCPTLKLLCIALH